MKATEGSVPRSGRDPRSGKWEVGEQEASEASCPQSGQVSDERVSVAPPKVGNEVKTHVSKCDRILSLGKDMKEEQMKYEGVYKKYRKVNRICTGVNITSNLLATASGGSAVATALTGVGLPISVPLAFVSGIGYVMSVLSACINKKIVSKMRKHKAIATLARSKYITLDKTMVKVVDDNIISPEEYEVLCKIVEEYYAQKDELRKRKVDIKKVFGQAEKDMREKLMQYLKK